MSLADIEHGDEDMIRADEAGRLDALLDRLADQHDRRSTPKRYRMTDVHAARERVAAARTQYSVEIDDTLVIVYRMQPNREEYVVASADCELDGCEAAVRMLDSIIDEGAAWTA